MVTVWRSSAVIFHKLSGIVPRFSYDLLTCRIIHLNMNQNLFLPPATVKGMTILNKEQFRKNVSVPCFYLPLKSVKDCQKPLKGYLLKLLNFKPITSPTSDLIEVIKSKVSNASIDDGKMAILDPRKITCFKDFEENDRLALEKLGFNDNYLANSEISIDYDNYKLDEILRAVIPPEFDSVSGYSLVGHIVHVNLRDCLIDYKQLIGQVLLDKVKPARTVVNKIDIIDSTFRNFHMELLAGEDDMIATVRENKCTFMFDFSKVYWNPRLCTEHERIVEKLDKNDILYDVFCGVGPFAIPAAKKGCKVLANDLNPESINWLKSNIKLNKISDNLTVFNKDGHDFIKEDIKKSILTIKKDDHTNIYIVMNLPSLSHTFLPSFQNLFSEEEMSVLNDLPLPKLIVYCFVKGICDENEGALKLLGTELGFSLSETDEEVINIFFVRDVAPNKKMMRVTLLLTKRIIFNRKRSIETVDSNPKKIHTCEQTN